MKTGLGGGGSSRRLRRLAAARSHPVARRRRAQLGAAFRGQREALEFHQRLPGRDGKVGRRQRAAVEDERKGVRLGFEREDPRGDRGRQGHPPVRRSVLRGGDHARRVVRRGVGLAEVGGPAFARRPLARPRRVPDPRGRVSGAQRWFAALRRRRRAEARRVGGFAGGEDEPVALTRGEELEPARPAHQLRRPAVGPAEGERPERRQVDGRRAFPTARPATEPEPGRRVAFGHWDQGQRIAGGGGAVGALERRRRAEEHPGPIAVERGERIEFHVELEHPFVGRFERLEQGVGERPFFAVEVAHLTTAGRGRRGKAVATEGEQFVGVPGRREAHAAGQRRRQRHRDASLFRGEAVPLAAPLQFDPRPDEFEPLFGQFEPGPVRDPQAEVAERQGGVATDRFHRARRERDAHGVDRRPRPHPGEPPGFGDETEPFDHFREGRGRFDDLRGTAQVGARIGPRFGHRQCFVRARPWRRTEEIGPRRPAAARFVEGDSLRGAAQAKFHCPNIAS